MSFCFNALKSSTLFNKIILRSLEREGFDNLTPALLGIFAFLSESEPPSISTLARDIGNSRQAVHKNVTKLAVNGYLSLESLPRNKKEKRIRLTERGAALVRHARDVIASGERRMADCIGEEAFADYMSKQRALLELLERIESDHDKV